MKYTYTIFGKYFLLDNSAPRLSMGYREKLCESILPLWKSYSQLPFIMRDFKIRLAIPPKRKFQHKVHEQTPAAPRLQSSRLRNENL